MANPKLLTAEQIEARTASIQATLDLISRGESASPLDAPIRAIAIGTAINDLLGHIEAQEKKLLEVTSLLMEEQEKNADLAKTRPSDKRYRFARDNDGHDYLIRVEEAADFNRLLKEAGDWDGTNKAAEEDFYERFGELVMDFHPLQYSFVDPRIDQTSSSTNELPPTTNLVVETGPKPLSWGSFGDFGWAAMCPKCEQIISKKGFVFAPFERERIEAEHRASCPGEAR